MAAIRKTFSSPLDHIKLLALTLSLVNLPWRVLNIVATYIMDGSVRHLPSSTLHGAPTVNPLHSSGRTTEIIWAWWRA
ncbi:hypothetical protein I7I50_04199 [Histoplasma capsulatum G186AR]|uniref:Uncharacterized protein n=1 Tax=Ajellomyces capsulatus TaxID=5037 RepID=A0A8H8CYU1_AJECA|nr:hypothetical protein I7I52_05107 [Histoplasma capsulatum]QSS75155.1 hypothetical protein I7I50_04199 [Histoplasma capsulatum G186AR]